MDKVFFDLETLHLFQDLGMSGKNRDPSRLKVAVAGTLSSSGVDFFTEENIQDLFKLLDSAKSIIGFNVLGFDYPVLQPYAEFNVLAHYKEKTLDMFDVLREMTGCWCGLDKLCELNTGHRKNEDTKKIPAMWREGKHLEVMNYLENDLVMTKSLFECVQKSGKLKYDHRSYGKSYGLKELNFTWKLP